MSTFENKRILIVDDSPLILATATEALHTAGYQVVTAADMGELENHVASGNLGLILMDVQMPELFGDDVAMVLRSVRGIDARIYLYSSLTEADLKDRARDAELDGYICKRNGVEAMVAKVQSILDGELAAAQGARD